MTRSHWRTALRRRSTPTPAEPSLPSSAHAATRRESANAVSQPGRTTRGRVVSASRCDEVRSRPDMDSNVRQSRRRSARRRLEAGSWHPRTGQHVNTTEDGDQIMKTRVLGTSGLEVSAIGLGCMGMTGGYSHRPDPDEMVALIHGAVERGVTFFDTAEAYGPHANEELVGRALAPFRDRVVIATKFAQDIDPVERKARGRMLRPDEVAGAAEGSLQRLGVETIDLYYQHRVNPEVPIEEFAGGGQDADRCRQGQALRDVRGVRRHDPPCPCRAAGERDPERVLAVVATPGRRGARHLPGARHRLRPLQPTRQGIPDRDDRHIDDVRGRQRPAHPDPTLRP